MNKERLRQLITMLDEIQTDTWRPSGPLAEPIEAHRLDIHFDMQDWGEPDDVDAVDCGYSACAVGYMLLDERFQSQGLHDLYKDDPEGAVTGGLTPIFENEKGYYGVASFFDISVAMAKWLFDPDTYPDDFPNPTHITPAMVAYRVRDLLGEVNS